MIPTSERLVTFAEAARRLPKVNGKKISTVTLWRWSRQGCKGVKLEYLRLGGRLVTSLAAVYRFGQRLAELDEEERGPAGHATSPAAEPGESSLEIS